MRIVALSLAITAACGVLASRLSIRSDFSYLLPQSARSVQDLRAIERRARVIGTAMIAVQSANPQHREQAAREVRERLVGLGETLVASVTFDRRVERQYAWTHRWLFADLSDLQAARDALADEIAQAKLAANPLYVSLDDDPPAKSSHGAEDKLRAKLRDAERARDEPAELVSKDGHVQLLIVHTAFSTGDIDRDRRLVEAMDRICAAVHAELPDVELGPAGDAVVSLYEHDAILNGMLRATIVTVALVLLALGWYFRSSLAIGALSWSLVVGTIVTFAFARLALGYLNVATAFLSSIVIGNGINVGIIVTARYLEELRAGKDGREALAIALERTIAGTFAAALTAAVAYTSLVITVFRGFRHFGIIGGVGMIACWVSGYTVLPAALSLAHRVGMRPRREAPLGRWLAQLLPRRLAPVAIAMMALTTAAGALTVHTLLDDPFENNFRNLRSHSENLERAQHFMTIIDRGFGQGVDGGFVIAVPRREDAPAVEQKLRAVDHGVPEDRRLFGGVTSIDDVLPADQPQKLAVLADIRSLLSPANLDALAPDERAEALRLRPPDGLRPLTDADVPEALAWPFTEADGSVGRLLLAKPGKGYEVWDAHDTVRFSDNVRGLDLPADVHLGGVSFVFADVIADVLVDGPRATAASALGAVLIVLFVLGANRFAAVTLVCGTAGTILMLGGASLLGFKINFLDFVALPITIGIGIEYAVNIVTRARQDSGGTAVAATGGAVVLCSYTTIVGYGSLLLSQNLGIRSFGIAAMLGEVTCLLVALLLAPALLSLIRPRS